MQCAQCLHHNDQQARFCEACGATLRRSCSRCGNQLSPDARFCPQCGAAPSEPHANLLPARQLLRPVYERFTEGPDTKDLQEAKALLGELRG